VESDEPGKPVTASVIGSFRRHYQEVVLAVEAFRRSGILVYSPAVSFIVNPADDFVRFESDPPFSENADIQFRALKHILASDFVFVVAPNGYIGRTTCYELGIVHMAGIPLFFSTPPKDLPIYVPKDSVVSAHALADEILHTKSVPRISQDDATDRLASLRNHP
jgi:hypothetical protein